MTFWWFLSYHWQMILNWIWFWAFEDWTLSLSWQMFLCVLLISHREDTWHVSCPRTCLLTLKWSVITPRKLAGPVFWLLPVHRCREYDAYFIHSSPSRHCLSIKARQCCQFQLLLFSQTVVINCTWDGNVRPPAISPRHGAFYFSGTFPLLRAPLSSIRYSQLKM